MKKITSNTLFILAIAIFSVSSITAQKFGHINSQQLLLDSPDVKSADAQLESFQKGLVEKGKTMVTAFEAEYKKYVAEANSKTLSPVQMQEKEAALATQQQSIQKYELEVQQKIGMKREELYKPIIEKINNAIKAVGEEGSYTMIFDTATGALLHAVDSENIIDKVKAKL